MENSVKVLTKEECICFETFEKKQSEPKKEKTDISELVSSVITVVNEAFPELIDVNENRYLRFQEKLFQVITKKVKIGL